MGITSTNLVKMYMHYLFQRASQVCWKNIFYLIDNKPDSSLLDLGCGEGTMTLCMVQHSGAKKIYGIELDEEKAKEARKKGITIYKVDLNREFPIDSCTMDLVIASQVIEHMINVDNFVKEIYRILKPGACTIIATENLASWHNIYCLLLGKQPYSGPYISTEFSLGQHPLTELKSVYKRGGIMEMAYIKHNTVMAYKTLKELLKEYGLNVIASKGSGYHPWPGRLSDIFSALDITHSHMIVLKAKKSGYTS